jgi:hypothetical protein
MPGFGVLEVCRFKRESIHPALPRSHLLDMTLGVTINHANKLPWRTDLHAADEQGNEPDHHAGNDPFHRVSSLIKGRHMPNVPTLRFAEKFQSGSAPIT